MPTFEEIRVLYEEKGDQYELKLYTLAKFKIGKTGQTVEVRFNEEYAEIYNDYEIIGTSSNKDFIDDFETYMIERFINLPNCDNEQIGGGEMADSDEYIVYLVSNE